MNNFLLQFVAYFIERQIMIYGETLDWDKIKVAMVAAIEGVIPGTGFDKVAEFLVKTLVDIIAAEFQKQGKPNLLKLGSIVNDANSKLIYKLGEIAIKAAA